MSGQRVSLVQLTATVQLDGQKLEVNGSQQTTTNGVADGLPLVLQLNGVAGNNTVTVPAKAQGYLILAQGNFFNNRTLRGVGTDQGVPLGNPGTDGILVYQRFLPAAMVNFTLNLGVSETLFVVFT